MSMRLACIAAFCLLTVQAQAQTPFDWSTSVVYDLRSSADAARQLSDALEREMFVDGMAVLVDASSPAAEKLDHVAKDVHVHTILSLPPSQETDLPDADAAGFLVDGAQRAVSAGSTQGGAEVAVVSAPPEMLWTEVDWESVFTSLAGAHPPRVVVLPADVSSQRLARLLLMPAGVILGDLPADEVVRAAISFRLRHPAVGAGRHERLVNNNYTFHRSAERSSERDDVVVVFGAAGPTTVNVSRAFADDTLLQDAVTGQTAFVSFGLARFDAHDSGLLLIEMLP